MNVEVWPAKLKNMNKYEISGASHRPRLRDVEGGSVGVPERVGVEGMRIRTA